MTRLSDDERRLGVRVVRQAPGDRREWPGESYRLPTTEEKLRNVPVAGGRERARFGVDEGSSPEVKRLVDKIVHLRNRLRLKEGEK